MILPSFLINVYSVLWSQTYKSLNGGSNKVTNYLYYSTNVFKE